MGRRGSRRRRPPRHCPRCDRFLPRLLSRRHRRCQRLRRRTAKLILTIALWTPSTRGAKPRGPGAAEFTTWAAGLHTRPWLPRTPIRTTVRMVSRIGRRAGLLPRRRGVVVITGRAVVAEAVAGRRALPT